MKHFLILFIVFFLSVIAKAQQSASDKITEIQAKQQDVFTAVEITPEYPGGEYAFFKFLSKNLVYPESAIRNRIGGRVTVQFVVEPDGSLSDYKIIASPSDDLSLEAIRVLRMSPHWKPGVQNNKAVRVQYVIPITFTLPPNLPPLDTSEVFKIVDIEPDFPGGIAALEKFIKKNMQYPKIARKNKIQGKVFVQFIVEKTGVLSDLHIDKSIDPELDKEALRIMLLSPKWIPGRAAGQPARVQLTMPINFTL